MALAQVAPRAEQPVAPPPAPAAPPATATAAPAVPMVPAGQVALMVNARFGLDPPNIAGGLHWRVYPDKPDTGCVFRVLREERAAAPIFVLPPGGYVVHVSFGLATAVKKVQLRSETVRETFEFSAGGAEKLAGGGPGAQAADPSQAELAALAASNPSRPITGILAGTTGSTGGGQRLAYAAEGDIDPCAGFKARIVVPPPAAPSSSARVVLYEEDPADPQGKRYVGSAIWRTETVTPGPGAAPDLAVRADLEIPERRITMTFSLRRNTRSGAAGEPHHRGQVQPAGGFPVRRHRECPGHPDEAGRADARRAARRARRQGYVGLFPDWAVGGRGRHAA